MNYRAKEVEVEAIQLTGYNLKDLKEFAGPTNIIWDMYVADKCTRVLVKTEEGMNMATCGDYIVKSADKKIHIYKADTFNAKYEKVEE